MKQTALIMMLLLALLLFTACHTDNDPWPAGSELLSPTATSAPTATPLQTAEPLPTPVPTAVPTLEPTETPGGNAEPGING